MKTYNFNVTRNDVTVRILIQANSVDEAEGIVYKFLSYHLSTVEYLGEFVDEKDKNVVNIRKLIQKNDTVYINETLVKSKYGKEEKYNGVSFITDFNRFELVSLDEVNKILHLKTK